MSENTFKTGDVVKLNSGGPELTIISMNSVSAKCAYFKDGDYKEILSIVFSALKKV